MYLAKMHQVHGGGAFDIRYLILRSDSFTVEEKQALVHDFYASSDEYEDI